jgi:uncharacterized protein YggU (UPF0235/DUF167 family)
MYLKIRLVPDSRIEKVEKVSVDEWKMWVKQPAERNLANERVLEIVREEFPNQSVRIVNGHHSPSKIVSVG